MLQAVYFHPPVSVKYIDQMVMKSKHSPMLIFKLSPILGQMEENKHLIKY